MVLWLQVARWRGKALVSAATAAAAMLLPQLAADRVFYGKWTLGIVNVPSITPNVP